MNARQIMLHVPNANVRHLHADILNRKTADASTRNPTRQSATVVQQQTVNECSRKIDDEKVEKAKVKQTNNAKK